MRSRLKRSEWTASAAVIVLAAALITWAVGVPGRERGDATRSAEPAETSLRLLAEIMPPPGTRGLRAWRELAQLGPPDPRTSGKIGFDGARLMIRREDGEVIWRVGVLLDDATGAPMAVELLVECQPADVRSPWLARRLRERWPFETRDAGAGWRARWRDPRKAAELEARARAVLGGHRAVDVPAALVDAYELLLDPLRPIAYAAPGEDPCGPEPGRVALQRLLDSRRDELVRNVLRGLDPEGRVYACEALLGPLAPEPADRAAMEQVLALDQPILLRDGKRAPARELLGARLSDAGATSR